MKKPFRFLIVSLALAAGLAELGAEPSRYPYKAVATIGMVSDVVRQVAGDKAEVEGLIGEGIDPHLYKPTRRDLIELQQADIIFYNGLMLEGKMADVLVRLARKGKPVYAVTDSLMDQPKAPAKQDEERLQAEIATCQAMMKKLQNDLARLALLGPSVQLVERAKSTAAGESPPAHARVRVLREPGDKSAFDEAVALLRSDIIIQEVISRLTPDLKAALTANGDGSEPLEQVLQANRSIQPFDQSWMVDISYANPDPVVAAMVANIFAEEFVSYIIERNIREGKAAVTEQRARVDAQREKIEQLRAGLDEGGGYVMTDEEDHFDPHVWMDVQGWILATNVIADALAAFDPKNAAAYKRNAAAYIEKLKKLDAYARDAIGSIPADQRYLVTAHDAFNYLGRAYGIEVKGIQGISTESEAGVRDIEDLVDFLVERQIPAVFVETSVSDKNVRALIEGAKARGHDLTIGGELFSDAMGPAGTYEGTYIGMIDHNVTTISQALGGDAPASGLNGKLSPSPHD